MHSMFKKTYPDLDANYKFYLKYFKENFSLRFGRPQVDTCITCEQLSVKIKVLVSSLCKRTNGSQKKR